MKTKVMKHLLFSFLLIASPAIASAAGLTATIKQEAQSCADALLTSDYAAVVKYTHPRIVSLMGGKDAVITILQRGATQMEAQGIQFEKATMDTPTEPQKFGTWLTSIIPQHIVMKVPGGHLHQDSTLLGISEDEGATWVFLDLGPISSAQFAQVFPELDGKVTLPEKREPVLQKDE